MEFVEGGSNWCSVVLLSQQYCILADGGSGFSVGTIKKGNINKLLYDKGKEKLCKLQFVQSGFLEHLILLGEQSRKQKD